MKKPGRKDLIKISDYIWEIPGTRYQVISLFKFKGYINQIAIHSNRLFFKFL
jgi:hypothetical protein